MEAEQKIASENNKLSESFINNIDFYYDNKKVYVFLKSNPDNKISYDLSEPIFYFRGDTAKAQSLQIEKDLINKADAIKHENALKFRMILEDAYKKLGE